MHFTETQCETANGIPIIDILHNMGEHTKKIGNIIIWSAHDSVRFSGSKWYRFSTGEGGHAIDFCRSFYAMSFQESVEYLLQNFRPELLAEGYDRRLTNREAEHKKVEKEVADCGQLLPKRIRAEDIPKWNHSTKKMRDYLCNTRGIDARVVSFFARRGQLYETAGTHHVAFVCTDEEGIPRNIQCRGIDDSNGKYRKNIKGSDLSYGFAYNGGSDRLYVFEAPIDMLSFITLFQKDWEKHNYLALNGISKGALFRTLEAQTEITKVIFCLDNDKAGHEACLAIAKELTESGSVEVQRLSPEKKDWNEDLMEQKGGEQCNHLECCW